MSQFTIPYPPPEAARWHLICHDPEDKESCLDYCCALAHSRQQRLSLLSLYGPLISNINIAENLWLSIDWHQRIATETLLEKVRDLFETLGYVPAVIDAILSARPSALEPHDLRAVLLVRAGLLKPDIVVIDGDWFHGTQSSDRQLFQRAQLSFNSAAWLVVSEAEEIPLPDEAWQVIAPVEA